MPKDRRISPAVAIIPIGLGLAAVVGLAAMAFAAPGPPEPPPGLANLYGKVTNAETGEPIAGVDITVYQDYDSDTADYHTTTDSQGYYQILEMLVEVDVTQMAVYANGYKAYANEDIPIVEGNNELNFSMEAA